MRTNIFSKVLYVLVVSMAFISCDKTNDVNKGEGNDKDYYFNVLAYIEDGDGSSIRYIQALSDLKTGEISPAKGFELNRSPTICSSDDGKTLYMFSYGEGSLYRYELLNSPDDYVQTAKLDALPAIGYAWARFRGINDEKALLHTVLKEYGDAKVPSEYKVVSNARIIDMNLTAFTIPEAKVVTIPTDNKKLFTDNFVYLDQIDFPSILGDKVYYGTRVFRKDPNDPSKSDSTWSRNTSHVASTLVLDYPSMTNAKIVTHDIEKGTTAGEHVPLTHVYNDAVYQIGANGYMMKLKDGDYDNSYVFNIGEAFGETVEKVSTRGWFHVGDGIGYCLFNIYINYGKDNEVTKGGVARIDLNAKTAIRMNVPDNLGDVYYIQMAKQIGDELYMPLNPEGEDGNVYIFDKNNASADGFTKGASLSALGGKSGYYGIF